MESTPLKKDDPPHSCSKPRRKGGADAAITSIEIPKRGELVIGRKATVVDIAVQDQRCSARRQSA